MHIETLKTFCDLVETKSFSRAAKMNLVSQSAVSQQLRTLEERYANKLIERDRRAGAIANEAGTSLYAAFKEILERLRRVDERMRAGTNVLTGRIRVATVYSIGLHTLPPHLKLFLRAHPQVNVGIEYRRTHDVYAACLSSEADLGIVAVPTRRRGLVVTPLRPEGLVLVCSPEHVLATERNGVRPGLLAGERFIAFDRDIPTRRLIDGLFRERGVRLRHDAEFDNVETIKRSVEAGLGVSVLPLSVVKTETASGALVALPLLDGPYERPVGLLTKSGRRRSPALDEFIGLLVGATAPTDQPTPRPSTSRGRRAARHK